MSSCATGAVVCRRFSVGGRLQKLNSKHHVLRQRNDRILEEFENDHYFPSASFTSRKNFWGHDDTNSDSHVQRTQ